MKRRSLLFYLITLIAVLAVASLLIAVAGAAPLPDPPATRLLQDTVVVTVAVTGTGVIAPTGGTDPTGSSYLFLGILIIAGLAFLVAIFALMRRPYP